MCVEQLLDRSPPAGVSRCQVLLVVVLVLVPDPGFLGQVLVAACLHQSAVLCRAPAGDVRRQLEPQVVHPAVITWRNISRALNVKHEPLKPDSPSSVRSSRTVSYRCVSPGFLLHSLTYIHQRFWFMLIWRLHSADSP